MIKKVLNHLKDYGFWETVKWLFNWVRFKIKAKIIKSVDFTDVKIKNNIRHHNKIFSFFKNMFKGF